MGDADLPLVLDTGSADLWVLSTDCVSPNASATEPPACNASVPLYSPTTFQPTGLNASLLYGDSLTGTHAIGPIGFDTAGIAQLSASNQYFAAVPQGGTNTSILQTGSSGIFGLGFPINSIIWNEILSSRFPTSERAVLARASTNFATRHFPDLSFLRNSSTNLKRGAPLRSSSLPTVSEVLDTFVPFGPLVPRLGLTAPIAAVTLQRDTVQVGGNAGTLSLGALPPAVQADNLTWVPLRAYTPVEGGLPAPADSPDEVYPMAWEVPVDDVFFDGHKLPRSNLSAPNITLSALIDTGSSYIRGPQDVVEAMSNVLGGQTYPCARPHNLTFQIGGSFFPVDPRDFGSQAYEDNTEDCMPSVVATDPPASNGSGFLYSWNLGDPFLKGVLAAFYYGNLTYPSQDPPRMGFLSTVPPDAGEQLGAAVSSASGSLPATSDPAPSGTPSAAVTDAQGVPQARQSTVSGGASSGASAAASLDVALWHVSAWAVVWTALWMV
ncbi:acid protease [Dentipellis sp. KUC8613]|nr:acid protease [Dentipellis sp. KUC8613]